jgi:hypothetical protein
MSKVVGIDGRTSVKAREPSRLIISALTELLERAKAGDIRQIAFVYVDATGRPTDQYVPYEEPGALPEELIPIIGGLELCKATLLSQMVDA